MVLFTEEDIKKYAFAAVIEDGRRCFDRGKVGAPYYIGTDIIVSVKTDRVYRVVLGKDPNGKPAFDCNCGFAYAGACEHVVAAMLAVNSHQAIQIGFDFNQDSNDDESMPEPDPIDKHKENESDEASTGSAYNVEEEIVEEDDITDEKVKIIDIPAGKPVGRIYLSESDSVLLAELRFAYHNGSVEFSRFDSNSFRLVPHENGAVYKVNRSRARESSITASLAGYGLTQYQTGIYTPVEDPRLWTLHELSSLAKDGFEIYGQEELKSSNARSSKPKLSVTISSGDGLFDCNVNLSFDGIPATLASLIMAVRQGSKFVLLADGTSGVLPQEWLDKFAGLFSAIDIEPSQKSLKIRTSHMALAEMLLEMADQGKCDEEFRKKRDELLNFKGIEKQTSPANFTATMRPYQSAGYEWLYFLKKYRFGGCLADDMGLGKTVQTIALLLKEKQLCEGQPSLIIMPTSLIFNWQREIRKFASDLNVLVYHGANRHGYLEIMQMADVALTSYGTLLRDIETLKSKRFHYVILDEAQAIKNPASQISKAVKQLNAEYRLALSGTPIENNLSELWSLFSFINPGMLGTYRNFAQNYVKPIERELKDSSAEILRKLIFPFILRRTKQQVAKDLPPKTEVVLYTEMHPKQRTLYEITRDTFRGEILHLIDKEGLERSSIRILEGMLRLRQICCHPALVDPSFGSDSGKFELLETSISDMVLEGHRVLVFSQFVKALELLKTRIAQRGIKSEMLTGATKDRQEVVDKFQREKSAPVFLISLKAGGTGLNLTSADYVILMDPWWNPGAENQASDRAYRIGQERPVFVYKTITSDSIEEQVLTMQERKKHLMESVIQTDVSFFKHLSKDEILGMFS